MARASPQHHQSHDGNWQHHVSSEGQNHHLSSPHSSPQQHQSHYRNHPGNYHHESSEGGLNHHLSSPQSYHPAPAQRNNVVPSPHLIAIGNNGPEHNLHPGQHAELRFPRARRIVEKFPSHSRDHTLDHTDPNNAKYLISDRATVEVSQQQRWPDEDDQVSNATENPTTQFGCYSIPESQAMFSAASAAASAAAEAAAPMLASSMAAARRLHEGVYLQHQKTFASCLYPKSVKLKLNVGSAEKPAEHIHKVDATDFIRRNRSVRVSLMSSTDSPEAISLKLFHGLDDLETEPEPENIEMPAELMPAPGAEPADAVVKLNLMAFGDTHKGRMHKHCGTGLDISGVGMRKLGIGAHVGLQMAHQFAVYSLRVLNHALHIYGPIVAKAAVSSYKGLKQGCEVFLHKSAPIASHVKGVAVAHMRRTRKRCLKITRKRKAAWIACFSAEDDSDDEFDREYGEMQQLDSNRPSRYDSNLAWKQGLRVYPDPNEEPEPPPNSIMKNCSCVDDDDDDDDDGPIDLMYGNPQELGPGDEPSPEMFSGFEPDYDPSHDQKDNPGDGPHEGPEQDNGRLTAGNFDNAGRIVPFQSGLANRVYYRDPITTCRRRLSLSPVPNKPRVHHRALRGPIRGHGLGALVCPPEDVRTYANPLKDDLVAEKLAVRADYRQNFRDLVQKPINVEEGIWRSTLRAYLKEETAVVRPEDVLLRRRNVPMKLVSREEFERHEEENRHTAHQHLRQRPHLQIAVVHHCVTKNKSDKKLHPSHKPLSNRGKDHKKQFGHNSSFPHLKHHDEFGSVAKHDDHEKLNMTSKESHGISSVPSGMEDGELWQTNPVHSSESDWKVLPVSPPPDHGKKRPHSPEDEILEQVPHSTAFQAVENSDKSSQDHHPSHHPHGKHQKLEVLSAPDSLMTTKFSNRPLRISKHELSSDRASVGFPAEFGQSGKPLKLSPNYSPQSPQLWQHVGEAQIAESLTVGSKGEHFHGLQNYPRNVSFERHILCDIGLKPSFSSSLQSYHEPLDSLPRSTPKGSNEHHKLRTPAFRQKPQDLRPRDKPEFQLLTKDYRRIYPYPSQKCHERLSRIPRHLHSGRQPSDRELRRKCPSLNSEKWPPPWDSSLGSSRSVRSSFTPDRDSKPIVPKPRVSVFKAALSFLRPRSLPWQIRRRQPMKHEQGHQPSKRLFWYPKMLRKKFGKRDHTSLLPSFLNLSPRAKLRIPMFKKIRPASGPHSPGKPPRKIIKPVHQYSDLSQISGGTTSEPGQPLVHSQDKISPKRHENVPRVKIFLSRKDACGVRSLLHGTVGGKVHIKSGSCKEKTPKKSFSSATGSKRAKPKKVKTDSKLKIRRSHETQAASKTGYSFPYPEKVAAKRNHGDGNFSWELSSSPRKTGSFQKRKVSPGKAPKSPNTHGGVARSGRLSPRSQGDPLLPPIRSPSMLTRQMQKYEYPTKAHLYRSKIYSAPHHGDNLWSSKFLTPDLAHLMQSLQRAGNIPSHTDQRKLEGQIMSRMHHEPTSKAQTDHELQSVDNNRDGTSSHPHMDHEYQVSEMDLEPTSKPKAQSHVAFVDDVEETPTSTAVTMPHPGQTEIQSPLGDDLVDNPQESDKFGGDSDRGGRDETSIQHFGNFDSGSGDNLGTSEASHHERNASINLGTARFLNYILPGDDDESSSDTSDEVDSHQMNYQRNPDISNLLTAYKEALRKDVRSPYTGTLETESVVDSGTIFRPETDPAERSYHNSSNFHDQTLPQPPELNLHINEHTDVSPSTEPLSLESIDAVHPTSGTSHALHIPTLDAIEEGVGSLEPNNQETAYIGHMGEGESNNIPESHHSKLELELHKHGRENETHFPSHAETHSSPDDESSPAIKNEAWSFQPEHQGENSSASFHDVGEPLAVDTDRVLQLVRGQLSAESPDSSTPRSFEPKILTVRDGEQEGDGQRSGAAEDLGVEGGMIDQNFPKLKFSEKLAAWETISRNYEPPAKQQRASDDMNTGVLIASKHDQNPSESPQVRGLDLAKSSRQQSGPRTIDIISVSRSPSRKHLGGSNDDQDKDQEYITQGLPNEELESRLGSPAAQQSDPSTIDIISVPRSPSREHLGRSDDDQDEDQESIHGLLTEDLEESRAQQSGSRTIDIISVSRSPSGKHLGRSNDDHVEDQEYTTQGLPTEDLEESRPGSPAPQQSGSRTIDIITVSRSPSSKHLGRSNDDHVEDQEGTIALPTEDLEESRLGSPTAQQSDTSTIDIISVPRSPSSKHLGRSNDDHVEDQEYTQGLPTEDLEGSRLGSPAAQPSGSRTIDTISVSRSPSSKHLGRSNDDYIEDQEYTTQGLPTEDLEESRLGSPAAQQSGSRTIDIITVSRSPSSKHLGRSTDDQVEDQEGTKALPTEDLEESRLGSPTAQQSDPSTIDIISVPRSPSSKHLGRSNDDHVEDQEYTQGLPTEDLEGSRLGSPAAQPSGSRTIDIISVSRSPSSKHLGRSNDDHVEDQEYTTQGLLTADLEESRLGSPAAPQSGSRTIDIISVSRSPSSKQLGMSNDDQDEDQEYFIEDLPTETSIADEGFGPEQDFTSFLGAMKVQQSTLHHQSQAGTPDNQRDDVKITELQVNREDPRRLENQSSSDEDADEQGFSKKGQSKDYHHLGSRSSQSPHNLKRRRSSDTDVSLILKNVHSFKSEPSPESIAKLTHAAVQLSGPHPQSEEVEEKRHALKLILDIKDLSESSTPLTEDDIEDIISEAEDDSNEHGELEISTLSLPADTQDSSSNIDELINTLKSGEDVNVQTSDNYERPFQPKTSSSQGITEDDNENIISEASDNSDEHGELNISTMPRPADTQDSSTNIEELLNTLKSGEDVNVQTSDNYERPFQPRPSPSHGSSDGSDATSRPARSKTRGSLFVRPQLKKSLVATSETEATFSQLRSENNRADIQDDTRIEKRSSINTRDEGEVRRSSSFQGLQSSDGGRSRNRGSSFVRPFLKKSLVASSETEKTFSRFQSEQREQDDGGKTGSRSDSFLDGGGSESRSRLSDSPRSRDSLISSDGTSVPARSKNRGSSFVRPFLKKSLVADSETQKTLARLPSEQSEVQDTRGRGSVSRSASFDGLRESRSDSLSDLPGSDRISVPSHSNRGSLSVRTISEQSLVADSETRASFDRLKSEQNEVEKDSNREQSLEGQIGESQVPDRIRAPSRSSRGSTFIRPFLKNSLVADSETEKTFARLQSEQNEVEDTSSEQGFDTRGMTGIGRSNSFESVVGSTSSPPTDPKGSDGNTVSSRPRKSLFTRPVLKRSLVANSETEKMFSQAQSDQSEIEERLESRRTSSEGLKWVAARASQIISPEAFSSPNLASRVSLVEDRFSPESSSRKSLLPRPSLKRSIIGQYEPENQRPPSKRVTFDATPEDSSYESYESEAEV